MISNKGMDTAATFINNFYVVAYNCGIIRVAFTEELSGEYNGQRLSIAMPVEAAANFAKVLMKFAEGIEAERKKKAMEASVGESERQPSLRLVPPVEEDGA